MERHSRVVCRVLCILALAASLAGCCLHKHHHDFGAQAPPVTHGVDVFQTATGGATGVDFATHPLPPGFFCPGSPQFDGKISLVGVPLGGLAGSADTVVERLKDASFTSGPATVPVKVRALTLTSANPLTVSCSGGSSTQWKLDVCLCGDQPATDIVVKVDQSCGCGHFDGSLKLETCLRFTNLGDNKVIGPINQEVKLKIADMPWCPKPMDRALVINGPFTVKDCDGKDVNLPGTSNFFPGYTCAEQAPGVDCWTKFASLTHCHEGPTPTHQHCVNPVCGRQKD
ncbi:MAG TPA: hypothetical protein VF173_31990 [Thermoanaerobaculia bacterium]|nr:hypothetical protein [Thermoanaerobaculia bacterium]